MRRSAKPRARVPRPRRGASACRCCRAPRREAWLDDASRTAFVFDVRTAEEFAAGSLPGARHAPGGQLLQATDLQIGVRHARVLVLDDDGVRAPVIALWLRRLGLEAALVEGGLAERAARARRRGAGAGPGARFGVGRTTGRAARGRGAARPAPVAGLPPGPRARRALVDPPAPAGRCAHRHRRRDAPPAAADRARRAGGTASPPPTCAMPAGPRPPGPRTRRSRPRATASRPRPRRPAMPRPSTTCSSCTTGTTATSTRRARYLDWELGLIAQCAGDELAVFRPHGEATRGLHGKAHIDS